MQRNDGGNFSKDFLARMLAMRQGSMSEPELQEIEGIPEEAAQMAMNTPTMGIVKTGKPLSEMAKRIQEAAKKTDVKWVPTAEQAAEDAVRAKFQDAPKNFFEKAKQQKMENEDRDVQALFQRVKDLLGNK